MDYYPYGSLRLNEKTGSFDEQRKFTGHLYDDDTGLYYMNARYQNPEIGRFVSQDPVATFIPESFIVDPQQLNTYSYSRNNPLYYVDPTGLYNTKTGEIEDGDTQQGIVDAVNETFGIDANWDTIHEVSFYGDRFGDKSLDQLVGESLLIGTDITADISSKMHGLNKSRAIMANVIGKTSLGLFAPNAPWDIKNSSDPILGGGSDDRKYWSYIYKGNLIRYDAPGNINYGYVARSLGLSNAAIQQGAGLEQVGHDLLTGNGFSFSDNSGDSKYIQSGIDGYNKVSWWKKAIINAVQQVR